MSLEKDWEDIEISQGVGLELKSDGHVDDGKEEAG